MKIDKNLMSLEAARTQKKADVAKGKAASSTETRVRLPQMDKIAKTAEELIPDTNSQLSKKLRETLSAIENSGLSPADVHSKVNQSRVEGLMNSMNIQAKRPSLSAEETLKLADRVAAQMQNQPEQALDSFKDIRPEDVSRLL